MNLHPASSDYVPVKLFVSYSHEDKVWFGRLKPLLKFRPSPQLAHVWHDQQLATGTRWDSDIRKELEEMNVFLCLISHSFYDSDYIMEVELPRARQRHEAGDIEVVPILLEELNLERDFPFLGGLNNLPEFRRPWNTYNPRAGAHCLIRNGVDEAIQKARAKVAAE